MLTAHGRFSARCGGARRELAMLGIWTDLPWWARIGIGLVIMILGVPTLWLPIWWQVLAIIPSAWIAWWVAYRSDWF